MLWFIDYSVVYCRVAWNCMCLLLVEKGLSFCNEFVNEISLRLFVSHVSDSALSKELMFGKQKFNLEGDNIGT